MRVPTEGECCKCTLENLRGQMHQVASRCDGLRAKAQRRPSWRFSGTTRTERESSGKNLKWRIMIVRNTAGGFVRQERHLNTQCFLPSSLVISYWGSRAAPRKEKASGFNLNRKWSNQIKKKWKWFNVHFPFLHWHGEYLAIVKQNESYRFFLSLSRAAQLNTFVFICHFCCENMSRSLQSLLHNRYWLNSCYTTVMGAHRRCLQHLMTMCDGLLGVSSELVCYVVNRAWPSLPAAFNERGKVGCPMRENKPRPSPRPKWENFRTSGFPW